MNRRRGGTRKLSGTPQRGLVAVLVPPLVLGLIVAAAGVSADEPMGRQAPNPSAAQREFFEKKIRPVLAEHCYECHSAAAQKARKLKGGLLVDSRGGLRRGGDSGAAIVPGKPDEGLLMSALKYDVLQMPPKGKLPGTVIADFAAWIRDGAADPREESPASPRASVDLESGRQFWSYQPLPARPIPPVVPSSDWPLEPIDAWIAAGHSAHNLPPAAAAPPAVLVRRLYFDLVGLPPSPEEIDEFAADERPDAVERLVDRLLASPRFGQRWARHWLDVVRFAESLTLRGFILPQAWRYRDYVIEAFNQDRPLDSFIREQVAGDLLTAADLDERRRQWVATTFLTLGNTNLEEQDKAQLRMDVVDEQLEVIGKAFLGQTIGCARCHDHKFDPIPTRDYYALAGILRNTQALEHANVSKWLELPLPVAPDVEQELRRHESVIAAVEARIKAVKDALKVAASAASTADPAVISPQSLPGIVLDDSQAKRVGEWKLSQYSQRYIGDGYLHDLDQGKGEKTLTFVPELPRAGRYEVRLAYSPGGNRSTKVPVTVVSADGESLVHVDQQAPPPLNGRFIALGQFRFEANGQGFVIVANDGTTGHVIVDAVQFLPLDDASTPAKTAKPSAVAAAAKPGPKDSPAGDAAAELKQLEAQLKQLVDQGPKRPLVMSVREESAISDAQVHIRGQAGNLGELVPRGFLQVVSHGPPVALPATESGRRQLAAWLVAADNPLTPRVLANRIWHWLFGVGIVPSCDNFGATGDLPTHGELLDYLARRLIDRQWSAKDLVREACLSRTYRMASTPSDAALSSDPENRWLSHARRRRLDAECLLDGLLATSGQLRLDGGGPRIGAGVSADYGYEHRSNCRAIYWPVLRNALPEMLEVFDLADPSLVVGRRNVSTVATQALFMMNDPLVLAQARHAAGRLLGDPPNDDTERIELAYRRILGRRPTDGERRDVLDYLSASPTDSAENRLNVWTRILQTLYASLDYRYVE